MLLLCQLDGITEHMLIIAIGGCCEEPSRKARALDRFEDGHEVPRATPTPATSRL